MARTLSQGERIARLEQSEKDMRADIAEIKADVKKIVTTLNEMTGGKKALMALFAALGSVLTLAAGLLTGKVHP